MRPKMPSQSTISDCRFATVNAKIGNRRLTLTECFCAGLYLGIFLSGCSIVS